MNDGIPCKSCVHNRDGRCIRFGFPADDDDRVWCKTGEKKV